MYGHINFRSGYLYTILTGGNRQFIKCELRCLFIHLISFFCNSKPRCGFFKIIFEFPLKH